MPPLIRRRPLSERIKAYLNPYDWLLWLAEEINGNDWDEELKDYAWVMGIGINVLFMVARANSGSGSSSHSDDVFGDSTGPGWLSWICSFIVHLLSLVSGLNAWYTFWRKRHYRLFESSVETAPTTPSARRVRVDSSPLSSSPLRFISNLVSSSAQSRAHPDETKDVWEISVWDPTPTCLRLFCLFSPGHVMVYWLFLPLAPLDPRPSVTVVTTMLVGALITAQLTVLQSSFSQQTKDAALIHREVLHEYDTKFVHPNLNKPVRNVGTQTLSDSGASTREVDTYTPTIIINRGFRTNPNPAYAAEYDPDNVLRSEQRQSRTSMPNPFVTPKPASPYKPSATKMTTNMPTNMGTSIGTSMATSAQRRGISGMRQPQFGTSADGGSGDGGSLGIYSHAASPLRKSQSVNFPRPDEQERRPTSPEKRAGSPLKRMSTPGDWSGVSIPEMGRQRRPYQSFYHESKK